MVTPSPTATQTVEIAPVNRGGRPPTFDKKLLLRGICADLEDGIPLAVICRGEGMPSACRVREWCDEFPEVASAIARARDIGHDAIACRVRETARGAGESSGDIQRDKLIVETDLKLLAKWSPRYAEKPAETTVNVGVQVTGLSDAERESLMAKKQRAIEFEQHSQR